MAAQRLSVRSRLTPLALLTGVTLGCAGTSLETPTEPEAPAISEGELPRWRRFLEPLGDRSPDLIRERLAAIDAVFEAPRDYIHARPAGGRLFLSTPEDRGTLLVLDSSGGTARRLTGGQHIEAVAPSPDGAYVALLARPTLDDAPLWRILDAEAGTPIGGSLDGSPSGGFAWLPDVSGICRVTEGDGQLAVVARTFATGEEREVWRAPTQVRKLELTPTDDGSQLIAVGRRDDGSTGAWLLDLFGGPTLDLAAQFPDQPTEWRAVGASGPLAFLLAIHDDRRFGGRIVAVDRRRQGAPHLEILRVDDSRIIDAALADGRLVVTCSAPWDGTSSVAIHTASGAVERTVELPGNLRLEELEGTPRGSGLVAMWRGHARPARPIAIDPRTGSLSNAISGRPATFDVRDSMALGSPLGSARLIGDHSTGDPASAPVLFVNPPHACRLIEFWLALGGTVRTDSASPIATDPFPGDPAEVHARELEALALVDVVELVARELEALALVPMADAAERINRP